MRHGRRGGGFGAALAGLGALVLAAEAQAAEFEVKALSNPPRAMIFASGKIVKGDLGRFWQALREAKRIQSEHRPLLLLQSPGGATEEAFAIGHAVKRNGVATAVLSSSFCASACSVIFFGGYDPKAKAPDRTVYGSGRLGVHHWGPTSLRGWDLKQPIPKSILSAIETRARGDFRTYYAAMQVSPEILRLTYETPYAGIHVLTYAELLASSISSRVATETPHDGARPIEFACRGPCLPKPGSREPDTAATPASDRLPGLPLTFADFLRRGVYLGGRRVQIAECTFWLPDEKEAPCVVRENGRRIGIILVAASDPPKPGWALVRERCMTREPSDECRVSLSGVVRTRPEGPILVQAQVRFLAAKSDEAQATGTEAAPAAGMGAGTPSVAPADTVAAAGKRP